MQHPWKGGNVAIKEVSKWPNWIRQQDACRVTSWDCLGTGRVPNLVLCYLHLSPKKYATDDSIAKVNLNIQIFKRQALTKTDTAILEKDDLMRICLYRENA